MSDEEGFEEAEAVEMKQRLKAAVHYAVGEVCGQVEDTTFSREMVAVLTEATFRQAELLATDLEQFAKHGKRSTVSVEDVKLCCRRNPSLLKILNEQAEKLREGRLEQQQKTAMERGATSKGKKDVDCDVEEEVMKEKKTKRGRKRIIDSD